MSRSRRYSRQIMLGIALLFAFFLAAAVSKDEALAKTYYSDWSWSKEPLKVQYAKDVNDVYNLGFCPSYYRYRDVKGNGEKAVCLAEGDKASFGFYFTQHGTPPTAGVGKSPTMYPLSGICAERYDSCLYIPKTDMLITKQYLTGGTVRSLVIYKSFSSRLTKAYDFSQKQIVYKFDSSSPDYTFKSETGLPWLVGGVGASENGKWLGVEFYRRGFGLLDLETFVMKRVSLDPILNYGWGMDPRTEIAVSNDGRAMAVGGLNAWIQLYENDFVCGDEPTDARMISILPIDRPCRKVNIDTSAFIKSFSNSYHPRFFNDGAELRFYAESYNGSYKDVALRPASVASSGIEYLAMGDSYTSGEGDSDSKRYLQGTDDGVENCHVSNRSYPFLIASHFGLDLNMVKNVACSGATIKDVFAQDEPYWGQKDRLKDESRLGMGNPTREAHQKMALDLFLPGRLPQSAFLPLYQPKLVTLSIGGNDLGLMDKLKACAGPGTCEWAEVGTLRAQTANEIINAFVPLVDTFLRAQDSSPSSVIAVVGYPNIIAGSGVSCSGVTSILFDAKERLFMSESINLLNSVLKQAALKAGLKYIDVEESLGNQALCGGNRRPVINEVKIDLFGGLSMTGSFLSNASYHPDEMGHSLIGLHVSKQYASVDSLRCQHGVPVCFNKTAKAPEPLAYWGVEDYADGELNFQRHLETTGSSVVTGRKLEVRIDDGSLAPSSKVDVEVHSSPVRLGSFVSTKQGGGVFEVVVPETVSEGYHTLHIYAQSGDGEAALDIYETLPVFAAREPTQNLDYKRGSESVHGKKDGVTLFQNSSSPNLKKHAVLGATSAITNDGNASRHVEDKNANAQMDTLNDAFVLLFGLGGIATILGALVLHASHYRRRNPVA